MCVVIVQNDSLHFTEYFLCFLLLFLSIFVLLNSDDFKHLLLLLMLLLLILSFSSILIGKHHTHARTLAESERVLLQRVSVLNCVMFFFLFNLKIRNRFSVTHFAEP